MFLRMGAGEVGESLVADEQRNGRKLLVQRGNRADDGIVAVDGEARGRVARSEQGWRGQGAIRQSGCKLLLPTSGADR